MTAPEIPGMTLNWDDVEILEAQRAVIAAQQALDVAQASLTVLIASRRMQSQIEAVDARVSALRAGGVMVAEIS